ncbi:PLAC8-like protein 1 [Anolis carolinensis]|uniref:PLAC8-like protein 1 n=1 Tax=Anolis carolinensis TaxID=28377 RepID=UPI002F2B69B3
MVPTVRSGCQAGRRCNLKAVLSSLWLLTVSPTDLPALDNPPPLLSLDMPGGNTQQMPVHHCLHVITMETLFCPYMDGNLEGHGQASRPAAPPAPFLDSSRDARQPSVAGRSSSDARSSGRSSRPAPLPCTSLGTLSAVKTGQVGACLCPQHFARSQNSTEPVTTQPSPAGAATSSITTIIHTGGNWSTGLFDVCSDKKVCVCGSLCCPILECSLASRHGECFCFPLLQGSTMALRAGIRERYRIHGTLCEDWMAVHCCWPFAVCQMAREMKRRPIFQLYKVHQSLPPPLFKSALV